MFFFWGSGSGSTKEGKVHNIDKCQACNNITQYEGSIYYRYFHFWYLFSFITSKKYYYICEHCDDTHEVSKDTFKKDFEKNHIPFMKKFGWLVSIIILIIIISLGAQADREHELKVEQYLSSPMVNDIYVGDLAEIKNSGYMNEKHAYGTIKLIEVLDNNRYYFVISKEAYNLKKGINKALDDNDIKYDLDDEGLILTKEQILKLKKTGTIYNVIRTPGN